MESISATIDGKTSVIEVDEKTSAKTRNRRAEKQLEAAAIEQEIAEQAEEEQEEQTSLKNTLEKHWETNPITVTKIEASPSATDEQKLQMKTLEIELVIASKKEIIAKQKYDTAKDDVKFIKERMAELMEAMHNDEKMPLLKQMMS